MATPAQSWLVKATMEVVVLAMEEETEAEVTEAVITVGEGEEVMAEEAFLVVVVTAAVEEALAAAVAMEVEEEEAVVVAEGKNTHCPLCRC